MVLLCMGLLWLLGVTWGFYMLGMGDGEWEMGDLDLFTFLPDDVL